MPHGKRGKGGKKMPQMNPKIARRLQKSKGGKKKGSFMRIATTGARRKR